MLGSKGKSVAIITPSTTQRPYPLHLPHFPSPESRGAAVESYPMSSPHDKGYDEQLLAQAPEVTKADLQGGYNPDILIAPRPPSSRVRSPDPEAGPRDFESPGSTSPQEKFHPARPKSFWKTRKGIIIITSIILIAVILGAVLGGVLGTKDHGHKTEASAPSAPNGGDSNGQAGAGGQSEGAASASSVASTTTSSQPASGSPANSGTTHSSDPQNGTASSSDTENGTQL